MTLKKVGKAGLPLPHLAQLGVQGFQDNTDMSNLVLYEAIPFTRQNIQVGFAYLMNKNFQLLLSWILRTIFRCNHRLFVYLFKLKLELAIHICCPESSNRHCLPTRTQGTRCKANQQFGVVSHVPLPCWRTPESLKGARFSRSTFLIKWMVSNGVSFQ